MTPTVVDPTNTRIVLPKGRPTDADERVAGDIDDNPFSINLLSVSLSCPSDDRANDTRTLEFAIACPQSWQSRW